MDKGAGVCYNAFVEFGNDLQLFIHPPIKEEHGKQGVQAFCFFVEQVFPATTTGPLCRKNPAGK